MSGFNIHRIILGLQNPELFWKELKKPVEQQNRPNFLPQPNINPDANKPATPDTNRPNLPNLPQSPQQPTDINKPNPLPDINKPILPDANKPTVPEMNSPVLPDTNKPINLGQPNTPNNPVLNNQPDINRPNVMPDVNKPILPDTNKPVVPEMNKPVLPDTNKPIDINRPNINPQPKPDVQNKPSLPPEMNLPNMNTKPQQNQLSQALQNMDKITQGLQSNLINNADRSVLIKSLLGLPPKLSDVLLNTQNTMKPLAGGTLGLGNINPSLLQTQKTLSLLFDETQPLPLVQNPALMPNMPAQNAVAQQDAVALFFSGMVSLPDISKLILQNSKQVIAGLIIAMAQSSKQGMSKEQIQETLNIINSCVAMAESNNPAQTLKSLMMLYIPWLPLNDGVGFDLEITTDSPDADLNDSKLTVLIQTKNFGNLKGVFTLTTSNSVDVMIICTENFPKNLLYKSLMDESTAHAMNTNIDIEQVSPKKEELNEVHETKVNLSATNEMNPYLLLMAHSFIRNTILIDNQQSLDLT